MNPRAGILVTGTEVLSGLISDRNGPWLSERLREIGLDPATIHIVGDRANDLLAALRWMAEQGFAVIVTSGGLGPTADDLTAEVVGQFAGREMVLDPELEKRIAEILEAITARWPDLDRAAIRASNRKQAVIPAGATILEPVGTAPGLVVPPAEGEGPVVVVLPGPPRELHPMWEAALAAPPMKAALADLPNYRRGIVRLFGLPESEIASSLLAAEEAGIHLQALEITTCLRRGEIEVSTRYEPPAQPDYDALIEFLRDRHGEQLFSEDGATVDDQVVQLLAGRTIGVAESCTGGMLAARLTDRAGSSGYFLGGVVAYSNEAKSEVAGVDPALIARFGAVSEEVALALAKGAIGRFGAEIGVGVTGIAGPGGETDDKPVGLVCMTVADRNGGELTLSARLPGGRADVRERATTVAMHLMKRVLRGEVETALPGVPTRSAGRVSG